MSYSGGAPPGPPQQQPSAEYVPAPTQFGNLVEMPGANPQMRTPLNQELTIAKLENTMASMEDQHLTNDPRYQQIARLKQRITGQPLPTQGDSTNPATPANGSTEDDGKGSFSAEQLQQLKAQVDVYKLLARQETVPAALSNAAIRLKPTSNLPEPYECAGESETGDKIPYDMIKVFQIHSSRSNARRSTLITPTGIDPQYILKERENRLQNRIGCRIRDLASLPAAMPPHLSVKAEIELRALRLVNFQQQMRREVLGQLKRDSMMETALNPHAYRRTKTQSLREARITEKLEKQQKIEQEKRRRQQHMELLQAILQQGKEFKEFHRNNQIKNGKLKKAVLTYHANTERERRKDEQKNEKLRMMKLIQEDEEGYRQLLDEKKDQRLVYLLQQTDEFIGSLTGLVKAHQATEKTRKSSARKDELRKQMEGRTPVRNMTTGKILYGDRAPKTEELDGWMAANPGFEVCSLDDVEDSGDEDDINETVPEEKEDKDDELEGLDEEQRNKKIIEKARNEEDEYDEKTKHKLESYYATAHRIREKIVKQHSTMGGGNPELKLKPYQIKGLEWMVSLYNNNLNGILADEMGLGKTIQTVALITYLMEVKKVNGPYLVIVPLSTISNWALELEKWAPNVHKIVYKGDRDARKRLDISIRRGSFNVLLTTYDYVLKEKALLGKLQWKYMIIDEGHRMKNHNCKLSLILNKEFNAQHRILLTGTPLQNKLPELWALLNFLLPSIFSSCHTFEQWFNAPFATTGEKVELNQEETMLIIRRLHKVLRPFLLRRLKKEVESQLPDKTEHLLKCDMSALQKILYRSMQKGFLIDQRNVNGTRALANTLMHLRKLCNHPFLFESVESNCKDFWGLDHITGKELYRVSGKFELLDRILPKLKTSGHRVLIFCQMTSLMNVMEDYFLYRQWKYLRLDGSTKPDDRGELLKMYNAPNSEYFIFMLSTRAGGLGLNLQTADTVIIFDSDWNPHQDMQAQDRAHRIGQKREVRVFRLITVNSVEERILAAAKYKLNMDSKVIQAGKFDQRSTGAERRQMLERIIQEDQSDDEDEDDVPDDDAINEMLAREQKELDLFMRMDIERRRAEAEEDPRNRKPRLVEENEIPDTIIKFDEKFQQNEDMGGETSIVDMALESGRRRRREVDYSADLMSEQEFMRQLEDEEDEDASRSSSKRSRKSEKGTPGRSKRKRVELDDDDDEDSRAGGETPSRKRKKGPNNELADLVNRCIKGLVEYTSSSGRRIAEVFESLPSRRELPDYYEIIDRPMDIKRIQRKLADGRYSSIDDVTNDVRLLGSNARKYNQDGSDIYNDSLLLEAVWKQLVDNIERPASSASTQNSSSGDVTPGGSGELRRKRLKDE